MAASKVNRRGLNVRQEKLALAYAICGNRKEAMRQAGYSLGGTWSQQASRLFAKPRIQHRIKVHRDAIASKATTSAAVSREWVRSELVDNVKRAKAAIPVLDPQGNPIGEWRCDLTNATRALELLGKESGQFADRQIIDDMSSLEGKTPEQMEAALKATLAEIGVQTIRRLLAELEQGGPDASGSTSGPVH